MRTYLVIIILLLSACNRKESDKTNEEPITIGISKIVSHPALDAVEKNIMDVIRQRIDREVEFDLQDANGETAAANSIAQLFQNKQVDLAIGIATPTTQALVQNLSGIPIFYSAITDPEGAGLLSKPDMQITGYSDMTPVSDHITTIQRIQPNIQTIGQIYSSDEDNARVLNNLTEEICTKLGIKLLSVAVTNTAEVRDAALSLTGQVDSYYITVDNKVISALPALSDVADQNNIPLYSADPSSAPGAKVAVAMGFDYASMGKATGELISQYLKGDQDVFANPINFLGIEYQEIYIDKEQAAKLGLSIPQDIIDLAKNSKNS